MPARKSSLAVIEDDQAASVLTRVEPAREPSKSGIPHEKNQIGSKIMNVCTVGFRPGIPIISMSGSLYEHPTQHFPGHQLVIDN